MSDAELQMEPKEHILKTDSRSFSHVLNQIKFFGKKNIFHQISLSKISIDAQLKGQFRYHFRK